MNFLVTVDAIATQCRRMWESLCARWVESRLIMRFAGALQGIFGSLTAREVKLDPSALRLEACLAMADADAELSSAIDGLTAAATPGRGELAAVAAAAGYDPVAQLNRALMATPAFSELAVVALEVAARDPGPLAGNGIADHDRLDWHLLAECVSMVWTRMDTDPLPTNANAVRNSALGRRIQNAAVEIMASALLAGSYLRMLEYLAGHVHMSAPCEAWAASTYFFASLGLRELHLTLYIVSQTLAIGATGLRLEEVQPVLRTVVAACDKALKRPGACPRSLHAPLTGARQHLAAFVVQEEAPLAHGGESDAGRECDEDDEDAGRECDEEYEEYEVWLIGLHGALGECCICCEELESATAVLTDCDTRIDVPHHFCASCRDAMAARACSEGRPFKCPLCAREGVRCFLPREYYQSFVVNL